MEPQPSALLMSAQAHHISAIAVVPPSVRCRSAQASGSLSALAPSFWVTSTIVRSELLRFPPSSTPWMLPWHRSTRVSALRTLYQRHRQARLHSLLFATRRLEFAAHRPAKCVAPPVVRRSPPIFPIEICPACAANRISLQPVAGAVATRNHVSFPNTLVHRYRCRRCRLRQLHPRHRLQA